MLTPFIVRRLGSVNRARRFIAVTGFAGAAAMLLVCIHMRSPLPMIGFLGLATFCNDITMPGSCAACMDIGGKYAGTVSGSMNMMGNLAGFVAPVVGGYILQVTGGKYEPFLYTMAIAYVLGALCWPFIDPTTPLELQS